MRINTNVASLNAQESATNTNKRLSSSLEKLSSGLAINKASDDASGLSIADKLRTQASSIGQAMSNGNSAVSLTQIADKAMGEQSNILDIVKQKLLQASTATTSSAGIEAIEKDINKLVEQLNNIAVQTNYNGLQLLQLDRDVGSSDASIELTFQMGEKSDDLITGGSSVQANATGLSITNLMADDITTAGSVKLQQSAARSALEQIDAAINTLNSWRSDFGSTQNQLESALRNMATQVTNIKAAESVIRDVDYAAESASFNKQNIIAQAGTYAMSQANAMQQNVMKLLQ